MRITWFTWALTHPRIQHYLEPTKAFTRLACWAILGCTIPSQIPFLIPFTGTISRDTFQRPPAWYVRFKLKSCDSYARNSTIHSLSLLYTISSYCLVTPLPKTASTRAVGLGSQRPCSTVSQQTPHSAQFHPLPSYSPCFDYAEFIKRTSGG